MDHDSIEHVLARVQELEAKIEQLEARGVPDGAGPGSGPDPERHVTRRRLLGMAGATAAGAVGAVMADANAASAVTDGDVVLGATGQSAGALRTQITSTNSNATFQADNTYVAFGGAVGVKGTASANSSSSVGVRGEGIGAQTTGVEGGSSAGWGVNGTTSTGISLRAAGPSGITFEGANLLLVPFLSGAPTAGFHTVGEFVMASTGGTGVLFQCIVDGTPGIWVRQSPLVLLASPFRVYDSRSGQANPSGSPQGTLAFGATRTINCTPALPSGFSAASALLMNLTVTGTVGSNGALTVFSAAVAVPSASSINWTTAGTNLANAVTSACDSSQDVKVKCVAKVGCSTNFIIDVIGVYP